MYSLKSLLIFAIMGIAFAEVAQIRECDVNDCELLEVRVDPCARDNANAPCTLRRRKPATMELDFKPNFDADTLSASLNWVTNTGNELPLITMDREACKYTACPVKSGEQQTYKVEIPMDSKFPLNTYNIKWALTAPSGKKCCFTHNIKLVR
ncbi:MD-2-related lipid-recognition protein-like [Musca domestica]|uniref:MD-2-related lipid-recognition protein-like n=1 Tax=Musca domestica TaxID=7370 RepID=A0ABM3UMI0_MUSDO|nr:MD-2-related lipid-recognition protein-like [Musca domestica]